MKYQIKMNNEVIEEFDDEEMFLTAMSDYIDDLGLYPSSITFHELDTEFNENIIMVGNKKQWKNI